MLLNNGPVQIYGSPRDQNSIALESQFENYQIPHEWIDTETILGSIRFNKLNTKSRIKQVPLVVVNGYVVSRYKNIKDLVNQVVSKIEIKN